MNKEVKDILQLLAIVMPVFGLGIVGWLHSPIYLDIKTEERENARNYLIESYYFPNPLFDRAKMIKDYGFTDDEISPTIIFRQYIDENKGGQNEK